MKDFGVAWDEVAAAVFSSYVTAELLHLKLIALVKNGGLLILPTAFYTSK